MYNLKIITRIFIEQGYFIENKKYRESEKLLLKLMFLETKIISMLINESRRKASKAVCILN